MCLGQDVCCQKQNRNITSNSEMDNVVVCSAGIGIAQARCFKIIIQLFCSISNIGFCSPVFYSVASPLFISAFSLDYFVIIKHCFAADNSSKAVTNISLNDLLPCIFSLYLVRFMTRSYNCIEAHEWNEYPECKINL